MSAFDTHTQFYQDDERQFRSYNPITKTTLITKYSRLLPESQLHNKTVLDLGSCLGAGGQWALHYGAKHYTGVEIQTDFVQRSRDFLAHWGSSVDIIQQEIRSYLERCEDNRFDIVVISGVLQVFIDPETIIGHCCRVAQHMVSVEGVLPPLVRSGKLPPNSKVIQLCKTGCNLAGDHHKMTGIGALPSKAALDLLFEQHGYQAPPWDIIPSASEETKAFSLPLAGDALPFRYFSRYEATSSFTVEHNHSLEMAMRTGVGDIEAWRDCAFSDPAPTQHTQQGSWSFDHAVAERFPKEAHGHIPNYDGVIDLCIELIQLSGLQAPKVIDIGCATGETLSRLQKAGYHHLYGVDNSQAMLDVARSNLSDVTLLMNDAFPREHGNFDVIIANWTLHFVESRQAYLRDIFNHLNDGGLFILTEKTQFGELTKQLYYDFKRRQGVSEDVIWQKEKALQGVLKPASVGWYIKTLTAMGFDEPEIVSANYGFVTFLVKK